MPYDGRGISEKGEAGAVDMVDVRLDGKDDWERAGGDCYDILES